MTTKPKARRFRLRLNDDGSVASGDLNASLNPGVAAQRGRAQPGSASQAPTARAPANAGGSSELPDEGTAPTRPARPATAVRDGARPATGQAAGQPPQQRPAASAASPTTDEHSADLGGSASAQDEIEAIRRENLTGRQLRMAQRVAQRHGIRATTGLDAVRLLRKQGIDPFERSAVLDIVKDEGEKSRAQAVGQSTALATTEQPQLPKAYRQPPTPATVPPTGEAGERAAQVSRIQADIARRRRRRMVVLATRLLVFVGLPTLIAAWYFYMIATPLYATYSEFTIQSADANPAAGAGGLAGALGGGAALGGFQESNATQSFLQSREAMRRLNAEEGFKTYFQSDQIDALRRLEPDATDEAAYRLYEDMVQVSYDPTEGIIRMEVIAADPATSERFARALVSYAEEQVDQLSLRQRENQLRDSLDSVNTAEQRFSEAQMRVLELQERYQVLSSEVEVSLLTQQITNLDTQLTQERLALSDLEANARPNPARLEQARRRIAAIEAQITDLRAQLTDGGSTGGVSLARVQRELIMAESDVATRQMLLAQSMQQLEAARIEANRQVRFLALSVSPVAPDEPTYPRAFENTALAFLIFSGLYLLISMTSAILREQVTG